MLFTAVIDRVVKEDQGYRLFLSHVESKDDVAAFHNGVILNTSWDQVALFTEKLKEQAILQVELREPAIMTMSLPPQIPGKVIKKLELIEK